MIGKQELKQNQYKNTDNLSARRKFFNNGARHEDIWRWVANHYTFSQNSNILEVGCGMGDFWKEGIKKVPQTCNITLSDFSEGMLEKTKENINHLGRFNFEIADVENLPYESSRFDAVIAHLMLYHADLPEMGLKEISRVLKTSGFAGILLSSKDTMQPLFTLLECENPRQSNRFTAEMALNVLPKFFSQIEQFSYHHTLRIREVQPVIDYIKSFSLMKNKSEKLFDDMRKILIEHIRREGELLLPETRRLFVARQPKN